MLKPSGEPSEAKALKYLLEKWMHKSESFVDLDKLSRIESMLEQIHVLMPQSIFYSLINTKISAAKMDGDAYSKIRAIALNETVKVCGYTQKQTYKYLYVSHDSKNMKTIPIEGHENKWKLS